MYLSTKYSCPALEGRRRCTGSGEWRFNMLPVKDMETNGSLEEKMYRIGGWRFNMLPVKDMETNGREEKMYRIGGMAIQHATC